MVFRGPNGSAAGVGMCSVLLLPHFFLLQPVILAGTGL